MSADRVGVVGLGNMGSALAATLAAAGLDVVTHDPVGPARSPASMRTGASTDPRRDDTRTRWPSTSPSAAASAGDTSTVSPRRMGLT